MAAFDEIHDPGLQQERTVLSWDRTGLALMVAAGILARSIGGFLTHPTNVVAVGTFLLGLHLLVLGRSRYLNRWRRMQNGEGMVSTWPVVTVAIATVLLGATALLSVLGRALGLS